MQYLRNFLFLFTLPLFACCTPTRQLPSLADPAASAAPSVFNFSLPQGYTATVAIAGLVGPTQMIAGGDGRLWVAMINGDENAGNGQVLAVDLSNGEREVLLDGLLKPVGIAVLDGYLWISGKQAILRAKLDETNRPGTVETILADLPFNGRSLGTLTVTAPGRLLYETSGARSGGDAQPGSAILWQLDPANPTQPNVLATGLKNAYAHTFDAAGRLWITDIGDDPVDDGYVPQDEVNLVTTGDDFGWPDCFEMQAPAKIYGGSVESCARSQAPVALFPPHASPTSIVASPWEPDTLLVALWTQSQVARVRLSFEGVQPIGVVEPWITGLNFPQHLLVLEDGSLLVSEFGSGNVYRIIKILER